ncbi:uncharacterized protein LOC141729410 [Zonotrichia albicollis]|uniref:uncharacterized protein LOC141729410 n=1 Tax=Zonotrichia albicollis TaxID=44394 RepID=UPI003D80FFF9
MAASTGPARSRSRSRSLWARPRSDPPRWTRTVPLGSGPGGGSCRNHVGAALPPTRAEAPPHRRRHPIACRRRRDQGCTSVADWSRGRGVAPAAAERREGSGGARARPGLCPAGGGVTARGRVQAGEGGAIAGTSPGHGRGASGPFLCVPCSSCPRVLLCPAVLPGLSPCALCPRVSVSTIAPGSLLPPRSPCPRCVPRVPVSALCPPNTPACPCSPPRPCACDPQVSLSLPRVSVSPVPLGWHGTVRSPPRAVSPLSGRGCRRVSPPQPCLVSGPAPRVPRGWAVSEGGTCPRRVKIAPGGGAGAQPGRRSGSSRRQ